MKWLASVTAMACLGLSACSPVSAPDTEDVNSALTRYLQQGTEQTHWKVSDLQLASQSQQDDNYQSAFSARITAVDDRYQVMASLGEYQIVKPIFKGGDSYSLSGRVDHQVDGRHYASTVVEPNTLPAELGLPVAAIEGAVIVYQSDMYQQLVDGWKNQQQQLVTDLQSVASRQNEFVQQQQQLQQQIATLEQQLSDSQAQMTALVAQEQAIDEQFEQTFNQRKAVLIDELQVQEAQVGLPFDQQIEALTTDYQGRIDAIVKQRDELSAQLQGLIDEQIAAYQQEVEPLKQSLEGSEQAAEIQAQIDALTAKYEENMAQIRAPREEQLNALTQQRDDLKTEYMAKRGEIETARGEALVGVRTDTKNAVDALRESLNTEAQNQIASLSAAQTATPQQLTEQIAALKQQLAGMQGGESELQNSVKAIEAEQQRIAALLAQADAIAAQ